MENMRHFKAVADWGNLNHAAKRISISPSAVSRSIKIIEEDLGYSLFQRSGRNILITQDGKRFLEKVNHILSSYSDLFENSELTELRGTVKLGASHWLAAKFVPNKLEKILGDHPLINFEIFSQDSNISILKVLSGELNFAICFSPKEHKDIDSITLFKGELLLATNKNSELLKAKRPIEKISEYPAIIHKANEYVFSCIDHPMFKKFKITPNIKYFWDSDLTAIELMKNKRYWTLLPDIIVNNEPRLKAIKLPQDWNAPYEVKLIWNKKSSLNSVSIVKDYFF